MNIKEQMNKVKESLKGKSFEQLAAHFKGWEESGHYSIEIDDMLMDMMIEADEEKFLTWVQEREEF